MLGYESTHGLVNKLKVLCKVKSFARKVTFNQTGGDQDFEIEEFRGVLAPCFGLLGYDAVSSGGR